MFERFTRPARAVVERAQALASGDAAVVDPGYLLRGLLEDERSVAVRVLAGHGVSPDLARERLTDVLASRGGIDPNDAAALAVIGIDLAEVARQVERNLGSALAPAAAPRGWSRFSKPAKKVLELSLREAIALKHNYIGTEHILLALARSDDPVVTETLRRLDLSHADLRRSVMGMLRRAG